MTSVDHRIGGWNFDPASNELRRGNERIRLEHRAGRALELLCARRGELVTHDELKHAVWNGRHLSAHSLPIVIAQLRRALGDDARSPRFIETVPKRGYRLVAGETVAERNAARRGWLAAACLGLVAAVAVGAAYARADHAPPVIGVTAIVNQTGDAAYLPLARATDAVILSALTRRGFEVRRGPSSRGITLQPRLVLWTGQPSVGLTAVGADHVVRWSGTTKGGAERIPAEIGRNVDELAEALRRNRG